jgi:hypothetical protein
LGLIAIVMFFQPSVHKKKPVEAGQRLRAAEAAIGHLLFRRGKYRFQPIAVTASGVPLFEFTQPVELSLHGYGIR